MAQTPPVHCIVIVGTADTSWRDPAKAPGAVLDWNPVVTDIRDLTVEEQHAFGRDGFVVIRGLASTETCAGLLDAIEVELREPEEPVEYEADLGYPGAPPHRDAAGGTTVRRLRQAFDRHPLFAKWATEPGLLARVAQLLGPDLVLPLVHHNCVMTKQPQFSSRTAWHQDFRYWSFERPELVSAWLALGPETAENGALELVPGSHTMSLDARQFDQRQFLHEELADNRELLDRRQLITLEAGDVLLFHCLALHSAGPNRTNQTKYSVVFTYRSADNPPSPGSRSTSVPEFRLPPVSVDPPDSPTA